MSGDNAIQRLEAEWSAETGFFWLCREGQSAEAEFDRALGVIGSISVADDGVLPRRLVSLLWLVPLFLQWQIGRIQEHGGDVDAFRTASARMNVEIERILGLP